MMINKRLIGTVPDSKPYIAGNVALQWFSLLSNAGMIFSFAWFLQQLLQKPREGEDHPCIAQQGKPLKRHVSGDVRFAVRHGADQPFVDHHGQTPFGRLVKTNLR